ncbi:hypothetical protein [Thalassospira mesophila]|uniref:Uncharacterized protein n=1 Tax=Thalassospira mesophila TaxID=1293891 RepID=A0A1Y2L4M2_9PROT|nr:hypothetical protein [Thalassospira mesophila]OSQ40490.1 hypothetical protein TMES_01505 [Thalassospira mesophila]
MRFISKRRLPAIIGLLAGTGLLVLAIPHTMASMLLALSTRRYEHISNPDTPAATLDDLDTTTRRAIDWVATSAAWTRIGYIELERAKRATTDREQTDHYLKADKAFTTALTISPMDTYTWARLTYTRLKTGGAADGTAVESLRMSLLTGPYERSLAVNQISYAIDLWPQLSENEQHDIEAKIRWIDTLEHRNLVSLAKKDVTTIRVTVGAMVTAPPNRFSRFIKDINKKN